MIIIKEVKTRKQIREFIDFPNIIYKGNSCYVPPLYGDEKKLFAKHNAYEKYADSVFFLAYENNKVVGRIQGILQKQSNEKQNEKRVRFTRFDSYNNQEIADALFNALEKWAISKGMDTICGPLGYNDLEREGLLIKGFDQLSTFEEQYNHEYYGSLIEKVGYQKEIDWFEFALRKPDVENPMLKRIAERVLAMNKLHIASTNMSKKAYMNKYKDGFFNVLDECYSKLYGTVPITNESKESLIKQFNQILNKKYIIFVCDENEKVVAFALCFPSLSKAVQKSKGHLTLPCLFRILKAVKHPSVIDLGLVAVLPEYQDKGVNAVILQILMEMLSNSKIEHAETNLNLETNHQVMSQWKYFKQENHKMRRSYIKKII